MNLLEALQVIESYGLQIVSPKKRYTKRAAREKMVTNAMQTATTSSPQAGAFEFQIRVPKKRNKSPKRGNYLYLSEAKQKKIKRLRKEGKSYREISDRVGVSTNTIRKYS